MGNKIAMLAGLSVLLATGCAQRPPSAEELAELEQVKQERAALTAQLTQVETKLIYNVGVVSADRELRARHGQISQVACTSLQEHWSGINRFLDNQKDKEKKRKGTRVASAERE